MLALGAWCRWPSPWLLALVALSVPCFLVRAGPTGRRLGLAAATLLVGVVAGFAALQHTRVLARDWPEVWQSREAEIERTLRLRLETLAESGRDAVLRTAEQAGRGPDGLDAYLRDVRESAGLDALAIYGAEGRLVAWDGSHQGVVPQEARLGFSRYYYEERPLFAYLYFTARIVETGGTAVGAALIKADLPPAVGGGAQAFERRFSREAGEVIRITRPDRAAGPDIRDFSWEDDILFSVSFVRPTQRDTIERVRRNWVRAVVVLVVLAWILLALATRTQARAMAAGGALVVLAAILPFGEMLGIPRVFSPAEFLLPGPGDVTLGRMLVLGLAIGAVATTVPVLKGGVARASLSLVTAGFGLPAVVWLFRHGASAGFVGGGESHWLAYQGTLALWATLVGVTALHLGRRAGAATSVSRVVGAVLLATALAVPVALSTFVSPELSLWPVALWSAPLAVAAGGIGGRGWRSSLLAWGTAALVGITATLPYAWGDRVRARMAVAEQEIEVLGTHVDPFLQFLLEQRFLPTVDSLNALGATGVELLYEGWVGSGLAGEGYPVWLNLWSPGDVPVEELEMGVSGPWPPVVDDYLDVARRNGDGLVVRLDLEESHYLALAPLPGGSVVTAAVPTRRSLAGAPVRPFFFPGLPGRDPVTLVPIADREDPPAGQFPEWHWRPGGWQAELTIPYPDGPYHAHYSLELATPPVLVARSILIVVLDLALLLLVWPGGRIALLGRLVRPLRAPFHLRSFRTRVTLALFAFFLVPAIAFGMLAVRTLDRATLRTAQALAERAVTEAAADFVVVQGELASAGRRFGADLLIYENGELREASDSPLMELALYDGWVPPEVYRTLQSGEALVSSARSALGRGEYMMAYRRLQDGRILASPSALQAGATALGRRDLLDLIGFAIVAGALLSLGLALMAGRALARPIRTLQVASERVGAGNLGVRLRDERTDEFGAVFSAFNRMVQRLRRARRALVRTTRRTRAIVEEAATGVVALDEHARVALANPRAESLVGARIETGERLPGGGGLAGELAEWVERYFRDGLGEAVADFQVRERRYRVRARRIAREGASGGAVLALEDVTDELRTERILAWGEMARQVAHEVKNPLTPIKLSIQHIRRAWDDSRPDFGAILDRNVDAILREIDRLAAIARSFSRLGAPRAAGAAPLEPVSLPDVADEILALYGGGVGSIRFEALVAPGTPLVRARESELKEVLVNLLENARSAITDGGTVTIQARPAAPGVELSVRDDGSGIAPELLPRIFEPHFSTRSTGAGLGLAIVRRLVESWGGAVTASSTPGEGTEICIQVDVWSEPETPGGGGEMPGGPYV